jgi:hypothetical protein
MVEQQFEQIKDICHRVFGAEAKVEISRDVTLKTLFLHITPIKQQDRLTQSQQEMDVLLSVQHALQAVSWEVKLHVL